MSLEAIRAKASECITLGKDLVNGKTVHDWLELWLKALKNWEAEETFERAFSENRMCMRAAPNDDGTQTKQSFTPNPNTVQKPNDVRIRGSIEAVPLFQDPQNFLLKKKNDLGLHDVSAVLLYSDRQISKQVFLKLGRQPLFIPIPHEEDLQLFHAIEQVAKSNREGLIYEFYKDARARITRLKYGSDEDMKTTFLKRIDDQKGVHYRYGDAHETAGPVTVEVLRTRRMNALQYKSRVLTGKVTDNNEVTVKIRHHAGGWPQAAVPGPATKATLKFLPYDVPSGHYLLAGYDSQFKGLINDEGKRVK